MGTSAVTVPSEFPTLPPSRGRIAFIGEAPGAEEVIRGRPLVGPSGRVFDAGLRTANIDRKECFVGNVFSEKAEENDVNPWMRDPTVYEPEFARLTEELQRFAPDVIVPLGGTALWAFTKHTRIDTFRGAVQPAERVLPGAKLVPTYHPARVIRQWKLFAVMNRDFIRADVEAQKGPGIVYPKGTIHLEPSVVDVERFLGRCAISPLTSVDIETGWGQITCIGFAPSPEEAMCVPFVDLRLPNRSYWRTTDEEVAVFKLVKAFMESPAPKLFQNGPYDIMWLWRKWGIATMAYDHDTRLEHHAIYPELEKSLAFMAGSYTDIGAFKHWGGSYSEDKRDD